MGSTSFTNKVVGIFSDSVSVNNALNDLNSNGFDRNDISVLARDYDESERVVSHSSATAYPDTDIRDTTLTSDVYPSGVSGSDIYPRGTMDPTLRGESAGVLVNDDYPSGSLGSNRFGTPDNSSTLDRVGDAARHVDDKIAGRDVLNNNKDYDRSMTYTESGSTLRHVDDAITGRDSLNNNVDYDRDVVVDRDTHFDNAHDVAEKDPKAMVKGATAGGALGLIAGLGVLLIPGIGPVLAAGPLAAAITAAAGGAAIGATAGTLLGILNDEGIPSDRADFYNRHFNKGNIIIMVHTDEGMAARAREILVKHNPETIDTF